MPRTQEVPFCSHELQTLCQPPFLLSIFAYFLTSFRQKTLASSCNDWWGFIRLCQTVANTIRNCQSYIPRILRTGNDVSFASVTNFISFLIKKHFITQKKSPCRIELHLFQTSNYECVNLTPCNNFPYLFLSTVINEMTMQKPPRWCPWISTAESDLNSLFVGS